MSDSKSLDIPSQVKRPTPFGTACFVGLRAADVFLQYYLTNQGGASRVLSLLGLQAVPITNTAYANILVGLAALGSLKHIFWVTTISEGEMPVGQAFVISTANATFSSVNAFLASWAGTSLASGLLLSSASVEQELSTSPILGAAVVIHIFGILIETISELQRKSFKSKAETKGKPYSGGLFSLARHVNYGGYALWRSANVMAAGDVVGAIPIFAFFTYSFISSSIPGLDKYCTERYGDSWNEIKNKVKWKLFLGIY